MLLNINATLEDLGQQLHIIVALRLRNGTIDEGTFLFEQRLRKSYSLLLDLQDELVKKVKKDYKNGKTKNDSE